MDLMFQPLRKYAEFTGRARRSEFWLFWLFNMVIQCALVVGAMATGGYMMGYDHMSGGALAFNGMRVVVGLALLVPNLAVGFRRLHDTDRSAWWLLLCLIPFLGWLVLLIFYLIDGTPGDNRYGPDPKGRTMTPAV